MNAVQEMYKLKGLLLNKLDSKEIEYKLVPSSDYDDLVLYPDNYSQDTVWFNFCRFYDCGEIDFLAEDKDGNYYGNFTEDEFLEFVKNFRLKE